MCSLAAAASSPDLFLGSDSLTNQTGIARVHSFQLSPFGRWQPWPASAYGLGRTDILTLVHLEDRPGFWRCRDWFYQMQRLSFSGPWSLKSPGPPTWH